MLFKQVVNTANSSKKKGCKYGYFKKYIEHSRTVYAHVSKLTQFLKRSQTPCFGNHSIIACDMPVFIYLCMHVYIVASRRHFKPPTPPKKKEDIYGSNGCLHHEDEVQLWSIKSKTLKQSEGECKTIRTWGQSRLYVHGVLLYFKNGDSIWLPPYIHICVLGFYNFIDYS